MKNFALNNNPMPDGRIEPRQVESFRKIGAWLKQYGESIYGTRGGPFIAPGGGWIEAHSDTLAMPAGPWWGGSTRQGNAIYPQAELQVMDRGEWRTFHHGTTIGENLALKFAPVTGR